MNFDVRPFLAAWVVWALLSLGLPGFAAEPTDLQRFLELDTNEDGFLSGKEAVNAKQYDANSDGRVTQKEYLDALAAERGLSEDAAFAKADGNEDGILSGKEMRGYEKYDKSGDGEITKAEFTAGYFLDRLRAAGNQEARKRAEEMFAQLDLNEDDRLSGTEMQLVKHYDTNGDGRVTREEFLAGSTSVPPPPSVPPPGVPAPPVPAPSTRPSIAPPRTDFPAPPMPPPTTPTNKGTALDPMVAALKTGDPKPFMALMNPLLTQQINAPVLELYLVMLKRELGEPTAPAPSEVETVPDAGAPSSISKVGIVKCSQGEAKFEITMQDGQITGFNFGGPNVTTALYEELANDKALALKFGKFYTPACQAFIQAMLSGQDDEALACFHPEVRKQLDKDSVKTFFLRNRNTFGELQSLELASFRVNYDENKVPKSFDLDFDMVGKTGKGVATATLLFNGLRCWMIHFAVENSKAEDDK